MKKLLLSLAGTLLLFSACERDEIPASREEIVSVNITTQLSSSIDKTRANGDASKINRFILQVYNGGQPYGERHVKNVTAGAQDVNFDLQLISSQTYDFVFWADCSNSGSDLHYNTTDLAAISLMGDYAGNDETRDAFFAKQTAEITSAFTMTVSLKRPFGQLNVKATDLSSLPESSKPDACNISFEEVYTTFNAITGAVSGSQALSYVTNIPFAEAATGLLSVDYLFAPAVSPGDQSALTDFTINFFKNNQAHSSNDKFHSIPVKRNYRTNVSGNLFTKQGTITVNVVPSFDNNEEVTLTEASSPQDITQAIKDGKTNIVLTQAPDAPATIELPKTFNQADNTRVSITLPTTTEPITVAYESEGTSNPPSALTISAPSTQQLVINTPQTSVTLNGQAYQKVEASTAPTTLIVGSEVTIEELVVKQGNVKLYGTVKKLTKDSNYTGNIIRCVTSTEDMARAAADNISGYEYLLVETPTTKVDGKGATFVKPMTIAANAEMGNFTLNSPKDNGITIGADNIDVTLNNITVYQNEANSTTGKNCAILAANHNNITLTINNSHLIAPKSSQRGINVHSAKDSGSVCTITLDNTHIGPSLEIMGSGDYSTEQNEIFKNMSDSRGISIGAHGGKVIVNIRNNSAIEGVFYAINSIQHHDTFAVNVDNSRLDGRCAFNLWNDGEGGGVINITNNSQLVGRNPFGGPYEEFATIVVNDSEGGWDGAANNTITVKDSEIYCYNNPETPTNTQYAVELRSPKKNILNLLGATKIYDKSSTQRLSHAVDVGYWINEANIAPSVVFYGNSSATILPSNVWSGDITIPSTASDGNVYIGSPDELAFITMMESSAKKMIILTRNIDLNNRPWAAKTLSNATIDGRGYTISNLNATGKQIAGFLGDAISVTIRNLTLRNATVTAQDDGSQNAYAGGFVGRSYGTTTIENCTLDNSTIQGINKVGGIVGFNAENDAIIKNCTVEGSTIKTDDTKSEHGQCGAILGYVGSVYSATTIVEGCRVIDSKVEAAPNTDQTYRTNSLYVGSFQGGANGGNLTIQAAADAIRNSTLNGAALNTSKYLGLLGGVRNTENLSTTNTLTINGTRHTK